MPAGTGFTARNYHARKKTCLSTVCSMGLCRNLNDGFVSLMSVRDLVIWGTSNNLGLQARRNTEVMSEHRGSSTPAQSSLLPTHDRPPPPNTQSRCPENVYRFRTGECTADRADSLVQKRQDGTCLLYTSPSPRDQRGSRMPSSA